MVQALLAGRKTQTRRILKPQPVSQGDMSFGEAWCWRWPGPGFAGVTADQIARFGVQSGMAPYAVGDRLWVRETWCRNAEVEGGIHYRADGQHVVVDDGDGFTVTNKDGSERSPWKSPLFMSRGQSRLTLLVTDVRVQRLQDISEADAKAEGIRLLTCLERGRDGYTGTGDDFVDTRVEAFRNLWTSLHGPESWAASPWVVAVTFSVHARNIDQLAPIAEAAE
jgi:hypothetical protein